MQNCLTKLPLAALVTAFATILIACEDPNGIGLEFQGKLPIETFYSDTLKINGGTVWQDSSFTSGTEGIALGRYEDDIFGATTASGFALLNLPLNVKKDSFKFDLKTEGYTYDSAALVLKYNKFYYGDSTDKMKVSVHRLKGTMNPLKRYVGSESIDYEPLALGTKEIGLRDIKTVKGDTSKYVRIRLNDDFGKILWGLANKEDGANIDKFSNFMKGIAIVPSANSKMLANFILSDASSVYSSLSLYSHENGKTDKTATEFTLSRLRFSNVNSILKGVPLSGRYKKGQIVKAENSNQRTFVQGGVGLSSIVSIPNLSKLVSQGKIAINRAEIVVEPAVNTATDFLKLPRFLQLSETQTTNAIQIYRNAAGVPFVASNAAYDAKTSQYVFKITDYVQQLVEKTKTSNTFVITIPSNDELSRLVINAAATKVKIYYTVLK
jgi:Domain of unknown function (DUF4270)